MIRALIAVDPTGGASSDYFEAVRSWVVGYGLVVLVALLLLGGVLGAMYRITRKAVSTMTPDEHARWSSGGWRDPDDGPRGTGF